MKLTDAAHRAQLGPPLMAFALALIALLVMPVPGHAVQSTGREPVATPSAGWMGRAIENPQPLRRLVRAGWPAGWSAGAVGPGTGFGRPGGSDRVREVQRRLVQLGYRPGPVDGLFGPQTRAAVRWFQFKHGLPTGGRVDGPTLTVLQARSDHRPLRTVQRARQPGTGKAAPEAGRAEAPATARSQEPAPARRGAGREPGPGEQPATAATEDDTDTILIALLILAMALGLGVVTGMLGPEVLRELRRSSEPEPQPPAPAAALSPPAPLPAAPRRPAKPARKAPAVLGYAAVGENDHEADRATAAVALRCADSGWSLVEVIHEGKQPSRRIADRPGLVYALREIRTGAAGGLVVAQLSDFTARLGDIATLLRWLSEANAFLGAADHELDTSTRAGKATARAVIDLGGWERQRITERTRADLAYGRFTPQSNNHTGATSSTSSSPRCTSAACRCAPSPTRSISPASRARRAAGTGSPPTSRPRPRREQGTSARIHNAPEARHTGPVPTPEDLLAEAPLEAAVAALAERNHHHLAQMSEEEREDAIAHWRQLAVAVLTAAGAALQETVDGDGGPGRAVIVLEDSGPEEIAIHASFFPQLEDLGGGEVGATPAQAAALELLEQIADEDDNGAG